MFSPRCYQNDGCRNDDYIDILRRWINVIRSVLPGGSWWNLYSSEELNFKFPTAAKPISVWHALRTMWLLVADEKWILYIAFGSLTIAAVGFRLSICLIHLSICSIMSLELLIGFSCIWLISSDLPSRLPGFGCIHVVSF